MLDAQRNLSTTYRISIWPDQLYEVTIYPRAPTPIAIHAYRFDMLPQWMQEAIHLLDWAHPEEVKALGRKVGETYWVDAQLEETA